MQRRQVLTGDLRRRGLSIERPITHLDSDRKFARKIDDDIITVVENECTASAPVKLKPQESCVDEPVHEAVADKSEPSPITTPVEEPTASKYRAEHSGASRQPAEPIEDDDGTNETLLAKYTTVHAETTDVAKTKTVKRQNSAKTKSEKSKSQRKTSK